MSRKWRLEGLFTLHYTIFELLVVVMFAGIFLIGILWTAVFCFVALAFFYWDEFKLHMQIARALENPEYVLGEESNWVSVIELSVVSLACVCVLWDAVPVIVFDCSLVSTYAKALVVSICVNCVFLAFKMLVIGAGFINGFQVNRGVLALMHRLSRIVGSMLVMPLWTRYFMGSATATVASVLFDERDVTPGKMYVVLKCVYHARLIWNFALVHEEFVNGWNEVFTPSSPSKERSVCSLDGQSTDSPVVLRCGHTLCYRCAESTITVRPFCPVCKKPPIANPKAALFDSSVSFSSMFCCV